jgi:hypothetical protein
MHKLFATSSLASFIIGALVVGAIWYVNGNANGHLESTLGPADYIFSVASSTGDTYFLVANNGNVGVNTLTPATTLDITGTIRAEHAFAPKCTAALEGAMLYERLQKHFIGCMPHGAGYDWHVLDN